MNMNLVVGGIAGGLVFLALVFLIIYLKNLKKKKQRDLERKKVLTEMSISAAKQSMLDK